MINSESGRVRPIRVLIALRISYLTDESTSIERQLNDARAYIADRLHLGWQEVGIALDAHVSATKQSPFERPELGHWLNERAPDFDLILFWKLDRFIRKVMDMQECLQWADRHGGKNFASVTEPIFDMTGPFRHVIIALFSALAEMEAANTAMRVKSFKEAVRELPRWPGGMPAYGFETYKGEDGAAYLRHNPHQVSVLREIVRRLFAGEKAARIADLLQARGEATPRGARPSKRIVDSGREYKWQAGTIRKMLRNEVLMGWKMETRLVPGKKYFETIPIIDSEGQKVRLAPPIFTDEEWAALQALLDDRTMSMSGPVNVTPFLDVFMCGYCRGKLRLHVSRKGKISDGTQKEYPKYRCVSQRMEAGRTKYGCAEQGSFDPGRLIATFEHHLLEAFGDTEVEERIYVVGEDTEGRMQEISELVGHVMADMEPGRRYGTALMRPKAEAMLDKLNAEYEILSQKPSGDRWEFRSLGKTWRELWETTELPELEELMRRNGVRFHCTKDSFELYIPERLKV